MRYASDRYRHLALGLLSLGARARPVHLAANAGERVCKSACLSLQTRALRVCRILRGWRPVPLGLNLAKKIIIIIIVVVIIVNIFLKKYYYYK
jgi:hypothetical protein